MTAALSRRDALRLGASVAAATVLIALPASALQRHAWAAPTVTLLGSGTSLSALVTAAEARVLVATGDDPVEFGNALARIQPWSARRIDLLLAGGAGRDLLVPTALAADPHVRWLGIIGEGHAADDPLARAQPIASPRLIRLPLGVQLTVEHTRVKSGPPLWRVTAARGRTRIDIVSSGAAASELGGDTPPNALVVAGADPLLAFEAAPAAALFMAADAATGPQLRAGAAESDPVWARRIFPGEAVRLELREDELVLPPAGMVRLEPATPEPSEEPGMAPTVADEPAL